MIEIDFVEGINRRRLPKFARTAGLFRRFAVIQHTDSEGADRRVIDERLFWALVNFVAGFDPAAAIFVVDDLADIGRKERPIDDLLMQWKGAKERRLIPAAFVLRKGQDLRLCMVCDHYGPDDDWPFTNSCAYHLLSAHDIREDVLTYLRGHADAAQWKLSARVVAYRDIGTRMPFRKRTRENTDIPVRSREPLWVALIFILAAIPLGLLLTSVHSAREVRGYILIAALYAAFAVAVVFLALRDIDVQLNWKGIGTGRGSRAKFIAWEDAKLEFRDGRVIVRSKTSSIQLHSRYFDNLKFWVFFRVIQQELEARGLERVKDGESISTPPYRLGESDLESFREYRGSGSGKTPLAILVLYALPLSMGAMTACLFWNSPQRHNLPAGLQSPLVFFALAGLCIALLCAVWSLNLWSMRISGRYRERAENEPEVALSLAETGIVTHGADFEHLTFWHEIRWLAQTRMLILFIQPNGVTTIVPKRIFASPAEATGFYNRALTFKQAYARS